MRTRTLHVIATCLIAAGTITAAAGLHPSVPSIATPAGALLVVLSLPAIVAAQTRRTALVPADQIAAARNAGYRLGLMHAAAGLLEPTDGGGMATSYARGSLHIVASDTEQERKAQ